MPFIHHPQLDNTLPPGSVPVGMPRALPHNHPNMPSAAISPVSSLASFPDDASTDSTNITVPLTAATIDPEPARAASAAAAADAPPAKPRLPLEYTRGSLLVILSVLLHGAANSSARRATHTLNIPTLTLSLVRGATQALTASTILLTTLDARALVTALDNRSRAMLLLRGLLGGLVLYFKYLSLATLPVTVATALQCTAPFFTAVSAALLLAEAPTARDAVSLLLTLLGAGAVARAAPPDAIVRVIPILSALLSALFSSAAILVVRATALRVHFVLNVLCISIATMIIPFIVRFSRGPDVVATVVDVVGPLGKLTASGAASLFIACTFAIAGTLCFNRGIQLIPAPKSALLRTFDIPVNFVAAAVILEEMPTSILHVIGCALITISTYITATKTTPRAPALPKPT